MGSSDTVRLARLFGLGGAAGGPVYGLPRACVAALQHPRLLNALLASEPRAASGM